MHLPRRNGLCDGLIQQSQNAGLSAISVENLCVSRVGYEHIGSEANCDFVIALAVEAKSIPLSFLKDGYVDLNRWRAGRELLVAFKIEACE